MPAFPPSSRGRPDGVSLTTALRNGTSDEARAIPIEGRDNVAASKHAFKATSYVGVRTARWSYVEYRRASAASKPAAIALPIGAGRTIGVELYDMRRDPYQLENLAEVRRYRPVRSALRALDALARALRRGGVRRRRRRARLASLDSAPWLGGGAEATRTRTWALGAALLARSSPR